MKKSELKIIIKEELKNILKESTGGYIRNTLSNLRNVFINDLPTSSTISDNELVKLQVAFNNFEKVVNKTLKGKGLIGF